MNSKLLRNWLSCGTLAIFMLVPAALLKAAAPDGTYSFGWFNGTYSSIYDISGTYEIEETLPLESEPPLEVSFDITLVQDGKGKISGAGITMIEIEQDGDELDEVAAFYELKGKVKTSSDITTVFFQVRTFSSGFILGFDQDFLIQTKIKSVIDPLNDRFTGLSKGKAKASALGSSKFLNLAVYDLPNGMDGSWRMFLDLTPNNNTLLGSGTVELSSGDMLPFQLIGKHNENSDESKIKLTGLDSALGSKINRIVTVESGNTLMSYKGKVLGQKIQWKMPLP